VIYVARQLGHDARLTLTRHAHVIDELEGGPRIEAEAVIADARLDARMGASPSQGPRFVTERTAQADRRAARRLARSIGRPGGAYIGGVSTHASDNRREHFEPQVEEPLRRARPLPPHDEMVIEDLTEGEGAAFLAAVES
jgi:hypothetical protein